MSLSLSPAQAAQFWEDYAAELTRRAAEAWGTGADYDWSATPANPNHGAVSPLTGREDVPERARLTTERMRASMAKGAPSFTTSPAMQTVARRYGFTSAKALRACLLAAEAGTEAPAPVPPRPLPDFTAADARKLAALMAAAPTGGPEALAGTPKGELRRLGLHLLRALAARLELGDVKPRFNPGGWAASGEAWLTTGGLTVVVMCLPGTAPAILYRADKGENRWLPVDERFTVERLAEACRALRPREASA